MNFYEGGTRSGMTAAISQFRFWRRSPSDWRLVFGVAALLLLPARSGAAEFRTVVIDAGHGGHDRGGIPGQKDAEKDLALATARQVQAALTAAGIRTIMTRSRDEFVSLGERVAIADSHREALFLSIHFNSGQREGASGIETYYGSSSSAGIAARLHRSILVGTGSDDRGVRRANYFVLRRTRIPAVLIECGFLTNRAEARRARSSDYQKIIAQQIARVLR